MMPYDQYRTWDELRAVMPHVYGYNTNAERQMIMDLARSMPAHSRWLEIGVYGGDALSIVAAMALETVEIIGMDSWENQTMSHEGQQLDSRTVCLANLAENGIVHRVMILDGSSHDLAASWSLPLAVLRVDGDHSYEGALADLHDYAPWVVPGGWLLIDDYGGADYVAWSDVRAAADIWLRERGEHWRVVGSFARHEEGKTLLCQRVMR